MKRDKPFRWKDLANKPLSDHVNKEGFPSYSRTPEEDVVNVLMTGSTANTFYVKAAAKVAENVSVLESYNDNEFLAKATVYARNEGYMREMPIASAVVLSKKDKDMFREVIHRVCRNPHDWQKLIDIARSKVIRNGVGRVIKKEIIKAIANMSPYHAMKYPKAVKDMIRIARPAESVNPVVIKYIMEGKHEGDEQLEALYKLKNTKDENEIIRLIQDGKLPYEVVTGSVPKMTPKIWEALLYQAPYFNLLRNLNNFERNGVFSIDENLTYATKRLTEPEAIKRSKLFPFRFYIAYKMISNEYLRNALERAMEISVENVPMLEGKVAIAPDVSGSMSSNMTSDYSVVQCIDVVGVFAAIMMKRAKHSPILLPFSDSIEYGIIKGAYSQERILDIASAFVSGGGTSLSLPVNKLLENNKDVDYFIAFTDNEEWVGDSFVEALKKYIDRINPNVKVYLVTLLPYRDYPVPNIPEFKNVHFIFGWSDNVLKYIASDTDQQIEDIKKMPLSVS